VSLKAPGPCVTNVGNSMQTLHLDSNNNSVENYIEILVCNNASTKIFDFSDNGNDSLAISNLFNCVFSCRICYPMLNTFLL
jgi:hypothetical protein